MNIALHLRQTAPDGTHYYIFKAQLLADSWWMNAEEWNMKLAIVSTH